MPGGARYIWFSASTLSSTRRGDGGDGSGGVWGGGDGRGVEGGWAGGNVS